MILLFEQLIDAYVKKLTPDIIKKFACSNGIELTDSESGEAYLFIQKHYKTILYNMWSQHIPLWKTPMDLSN